jgi:hypothetical protein
VLKTRKIPDTFMNKKPQRKKEILKQLVVQRGLDRKHYFATAGEATRWRGRKLVQRNKKKYTRKVKFK